MKKLALTDTQALAVLKTLIERIQVRFKMHRGRLSREDLSVQRVALRLAKDLGEVGTIHVFPAMRWNAKQRRAW